MNLTDFADVTSDRLDFDPLTGNYSTSGGSFPLALEACGSDAVGLVGEFAQGKLNAGDIIDSNLNFGSFQSYSSISATVPTIVGYRMTGQGVGNNETYYGWLEFQSPGTSGSFTFTRFAIEDSGQPIVAAVPEPAATATLFGVIALLAVIGSRRFRGGRAVKQPS